MWINTAPTLSLGDFSGHSNKPGYYKAGDIITLTVSGTKGTNEPETWDTITFTATLAGKEGTVVPSDTGAGTSNGSAVITWNVRDLGITDGNYKATVTVTDVRGVTETKTTGSICVDITAPDAPTIDVNEDWTNQNVPFTITAGNANISGLDHVSYVLTGSTEKAETTGTADTISNQGVTTITAYTYDNAGNRSEAAVKTVHIERIAPTITFTPNGVSEYAQSHSTVVTVEDLGEFVSGVVASSLKYVWSTSNTAPTQAELEAGTAFATGDTITTPGNVSAKYYLWVIAKDNAGNVAIVGSNEFWVDNVPVKVTFTPMENTTYEKHHAVTVVVEDVWGAINSGLDATTVKYQWTESRDIPSEESFATLGEAFATGDTIDSVVKLPDATGVYYLWVLAKDNVGNTIITRSDEQKIDNDAPSLEYTFIGNEGVYSGVHFEIEDIFNGLTRSGVEDVELKYTIDTVNRKPDIDSYTYLYDNHQDNRFPENIEGQYYFFVIAKDKAGNYTEKQAIITIDTKQPVITFNPDGNETFLNRQSSVVTISDYSMIMQAKYAWTQSDTDIPNDELFINTFATGDTITTPEGLTGQWYLWVLAEDKANNQIRAVSKVFNLDNTAPKVTFETNGDSHYENQHTTKVDVSETIEESGVNESSLKYMWVKGSEVVTKEQVLEEGISFVNGDTIATPAGEEGIYYLWIYAEDNTGNSNVTVSNPFYVDDKLPVVTFDPYENKAYSPDHNTKVTFTDEGSKIKEDSLKYVWVLLGEEEPDESEFVNSFNNEDFITTPEKGQGKYILWVMGEDNVGNVVKANSGEFWLDNVELPIDIQIIGVENTGVGVHITVDGSVKEFKPETLKYLITDTPARPLVTAYSEGFTNDSDVFFEKGIEKQAYIWAMAEDMNGIVHMQYIYMIIDTKGPEVTFNPNGNMDDMTIKNTVVTIKDYSILTESKYLWVNDPDYVPTKEEVIHEFLTGDTIEKPDVDGDYYLWVYAKDLVDNDTLVRSEVFLIDTTAPDAPWISGDKLDENGNKIENGEVPNNGFSNKDVLITITPGEDDREFPTEINSVVITKDGKDVTDTLEKDSEGNYILTEEGEYVVTATTIDKAGNVSEEATYTVTIDKTPPAAPDLTAEENITKGKELEDGDATKEDVKVTVDEDEEGEETTITIKDKDGNDVTEKYTDPDTGEIIITEEGTYEITATTTDEAGNETSITKTITIDRTAPEKPTIQGKENGGNNRVIADGGLTKEDVIVTIKPGKDSSELACEVEVKVMKDGKDITDTLERDSEGNFILTEEGTYEFTAITVDLAGNESEETTYEVTIVRTKPDAPILNVVENKPEGEEIPDGEITEEDVKVTVDEDEPGEKTTITIKDQDGNDVTEKYTDPDTGEIVITDEGTFEIIAKTEDEVGNESDEVKQTVTIDKVAPEAPAIKGQENTEDKKQVPNGGKTNQDVLITVTPGKDTREDSVTTVEITIKKDGVDITDEITINEDGTFVLTEEGTYEITAVTKDDSGKTSEETKYEVTIDKSLINAPEIIATEYPTSDGEDPVVVPDGKPTQEDVKVEIIPENPDETIHVTIKDQDGNDVTDKFKDPETGEIIIDEEGEYEVIASVTNPDDEESGEVSQTIIIDRTSPEKPNIIGREEETRKEIPSGTKTSKDVLIEVKPGNDNTDGEVTVIVKITKDGQEMTIAPNADGKYELTEEGTYVITAITVDEAGNQSEEATYEVVINRTTPDAPVITATEKTETPEEPGKVVPDGGVTNKPVDVTVDEDEPGETTKVTIFDKDGNDVTDEFTDPETGKIEIDEEGEYTIKAETTNDETGKTAESEITITIDMTAPVVADKSVQTNKNTAVTSKVEASDNVAVIEFIVTVLPTNGTVTFNTTTGEFTYTPNKDFTGVDTFKVVAKDGAGNVSEEATITINVKATSNGGNGGNGGSNGGNGSNSGKDDDFDLIKEEGTHTWYIRGYEDGTVRADNYITREEMAMIFYRLTMSSDKDTFTVNGASYSDVEEGRWSSIAIAYLKAKGIMKGYPDGTFRPTNKITRAEFAVIIERYLKVAGQNTVRFTDVEEDFWAAQSIELVAAQGWMQGYTDGSFKPMNQITRAETMTAINRMLERKLDVVEKEMNIFSDLSETHWAYKEIIEATTTHEYTKDKNKIEIWVTYEYPSENER